MGSKTPQLQTLALNILSVCLGKQIRLEPEWPPREENSQVDLISRIIDYDDWRLDPVVFADLDKRWVHILLTGLPTLTIDKYLASTPDFLVQALKQLMLSPVIGKKKLTGGVHQSTLLPKCYSMLEKPRPMGH